MKKVITMTHCDRPQYTKRVLESLSRCIGVDQYLILASIEPGNDEVIEMVRKVYFCECKMSVNPKKLGCSTNTYVSLKKGFEGADFVLHVEDDVCLAPDSLLYAEFCSDKFSKDPEIYTMSLFHRAICNEADFFSVSKRSWFTPWAWGTWKDRWHELSGMSSNWDFDESRGGWDVHINHNLRKNRSEVHPMLSRSQNIGSEMGVHTPSAEWHKENVYSEFWSGDPKIQGKISEDIRLWANKNEC